MLPSVLPCILPSMLSGVLKYMLPSILTCMLCFTKYFCSPNTVPNIICNRHRFCCCISKLPALHQICVSTQHSWLGRTYIKRDSLSEQDCSSVDEWLVMSPEVKLHMQSKSLVLKISIVWDSCQNIQNEFKLWRHLPECISVV